jgi:negative regulator of sigma-B (phosphoserine phosphatase)
MKAALETGVCVRPYPGLVSCGDAALCLPGPKGSSGLFVVVDALGHGPDAARSAERVVTTIRDAGPMPLPELFAACDRALRNLREVVMSAIRVDADDGKAWFAGLGNVEIIGLARMSRPVPSPGRVGRGVRRVREWPLPAERGQRWALVSDGIRQRDLRAAFDSALEMSPADAAKHLVTTAARPDDDASALVLDFVRGTP